MSQTIRSPLSNLLQQALGAHRQGQLDTAAALYQQILTAAPTHFDAMHMLGVIHAARGQNERAVELIGKAAQTNKRDSAVHNNLCMVLRNLGRHAEALAAGTKAISLQVDNGNAHYNRALALLDMKRYDQALAGFRKAITLAPGLVEAHTNLGVTLQALDRFDEAHAAFTKAAALLPGSADAFHNIGCVLQRMKRLPEARRAFEEAIARQPGHAQAHVALSECLLVAGEYERGWQEYEWRWRIPLLAPWVRNCPQPAWQGGQDIAGKTVLIYTEQGLGDGLQFARYVKNVRARGATVILEVPPSLKELMTTLEGADHVIATGDPLPAFDMHCALLSLPAALNIGGDFGNGAPYLKAPAAAVEKWRDRVPATGVRCGVVWSGSALARGTGVYRSIPLNTFKRIADSGVTLIGLQRDVPDSDRAALEDFPALHNLASDFESFADTAAVIATLDVVVTVDTAVAHLAGAMGKRVWILLAYLPDWRWEFRPGNDTPWYPTARLYRQPTLHDWDAVLEQVITDLRGVKPA
jgi:tetratricopeptide (TPR) repeat protein